MDFNDLPFRVRRSAKTKKPEKFFFRSRRRGTSQLASRDCRCGNEQDRIRHRAASTRSFYEKTSATLLRAIEAGGPHGALIASELPHRDETSIKMMFSIIRSIFSATRPKDGILPMRIVRYYRTRRFSRGYREGSEVIDLSHDRSRAARRRGESVRGGPMRRALVSAPDPAKPLSSPPEAASASVSSQDHLAWV